MRKPSPIRVWNWLAAAGLLFCLASFAAAQTTPKVGKDPATGHSTTQAQTAEPALHSPVQEDENYLRAREEWFLEGRRLPDGSVGGGMRLKAIEQANQMLEAQRKMGLIPPEGAVPPSEVFPANTSWTGIGPAPIAVPGPGAFPGFSFPFFGSPSIAGRVAAIAVNPKNKDVVFLGAAAGGVWKSTDGGLHWTPKTDTQKSLSTGSIAIDPSSCTVVDCSTIYVGTGEDNNSGDSYYGAGILKSTDFGSTWTQQGAGVFVGPFSASRLDGAAHIGALAVDPFTPTPGSQVVLAGADFVSSGTKSGLYRSPDGGATWIQTSVAGITGIPVTAVAFDSNNSGVVYAALGAGSGAAGNAVYRSIDHGAIWTKLPGTGANVFPTTTVGRIALSLISAPMGSSGSATIWAAVANSDQAAFLGLFKSTDSGTNWSAVTLPDDPCSGQCAYDLAVVVDPANPSIVYLGGSAGAFSSDSFINSKALVRSTDGGATWRSVALGATLGVHADLHALTFAADGSRLFVGNDGGAWRTDNPDAALGTLDYTNLNGTLAITMHYPGHGTVHPSDQNAGFVGEQDNGSARFSGSTTWDGVPPGGDGTETAIDPMIPSVVYTGAQFVNIFRSNFDGLSNFTRVTNGINPNGTDRVPFIAPLTHDANISGRLYFGTNFLYVTTDYGESWAQIPQDLTVGTGSIRAIAVTKADSNVVYAGTSTGATTSKVWKTTNALLNAGATWTNITDSTVLPTNRIVTSMAVDPNNPAIVYVAYSGFSGFGEAKDHVFRSPDGGATWQAIGGTGMTALPNIPVNDLFADPNVSNQVFAATDIGVYSTQNASLGSSTVWSPLTGTDGKPLPNVVVLNLNGRERSRTLRAATSGRSIFDIQDPNFVPPAGPFASSIHPSSALAGSGGVSGVVLDGANFTGTSVVRWNGSAANITTHPGTANQLTFDIAASLLANAGVADVTVFDGGLESKKLRFSINGGVPTITEPLVPPSIATGSPSFDLTVNGTGFVCGGAGGTSEVLFNKKPHAPTMCSSTSLKVHIDMSEVVLGGSVPVIAFAPPPGGGRSNTVLFTISSPPPINDNFANALTASPTPYTNMQDTSGATTESTDPFPPASCVGSIGPGRTNTIWYGFTAPSNGTINADTLTSNYDTVLTAITGSAPGSIVACDDDGGGPAGPSIISFAATSGVHYSFMVGGFGPPSTSFGAAVFHLTFTPASDFTISSPTGPQTVAAGASATFTITVATQGGTLANDVTFSVTGLPGASTGMFNPTSFAKGTNGGMSTLTVATTKRMAVPPPSSPRAPRPNPLLWLLAAVLAMMSYSLLRRGWRTRRLALYLPLALLVLAAAFITGCGGGGGGGGGGGQTGTPAGTYPLTVTATSGGVSHSAMVTLIVN